MFNIIKYKFEILFAILGVSILFFNFIFIAEPLPILFPILNMVGGLMTVIPPTLLFYTKFKRSKQIEQQFLIFISDLTESIDTGMTLPMALKNVSKKNYYFLTPAVKKLAAQVDWGIPFEKALQVFARSTKSILIQRSITTIIQTYKVGGKISDTLKSIGESLLIIEKIRKERSTSVKTQIITSYMIYFIFILILVTLQIFLIPSLAFDTDVSEIGTFVTGGAGSDFSPELYSQSFVIFIVIQGFFAGLVTGKLAEGSIIAGFKHSIFLIAVGYTVFSVASQIDIPVFII